MHFATLFFAWYMLVQSSLMFFGAMMTKRDAWQNFTFFFVVIPTIILSLLVIL